MRRVASLLALGLVTIDPAPPPRPTTVPPASPLVVHEWGTITTRHAPNGTPIGRLNRIAPAEVLPAFVRRYEPPPTRRDSQSSLLKTPVTPGRPDVTMRLETPVIYFHPAPGSDALPRFDVNVRLRGGVLNEFYPNADASVEVDVERVNAKMDAGLVKSWDGAVLDNYVVGGLRWRGLSLRDSVDQPRTSSRVWLAPRHVRSSGVVTPAGEGEQYLFYRGVAHLSALVQTRVSAAEVWLRAPERLQWMRTPSMTIASLWLVDVRRDGQTAFHELKNTVISRDAPSRELARLARFSPAEHSVAGIEALRRSMRQALMTAGLFGDEADAMLETWNESYFQTPGLRLFYIVPPEWTAYFLPLQISVPHELTRVLVGRIDLLL